MSGCGLRRAGFVAVLLAMGLAVGCQGPQKRIEQLTQELEQVRSDLTSAQEQLQQAKQAAEQYKQQSEQLRGQVSDLQTRLAELQKKLKEAEAKGAAYREGQWVVAPGVSMISISAELLFDPGKAVLKPSAKRRLQEVARKIRAEYAGRDIYVVGHTDSDPIRKSPWKDNWELSVQRALTVARALIAAGVDPKHIVAAGCGQYRPRASNATAAGKAKNRRVEIYAVVPASSVPAGK